MSGNTEQATQTLHRAHARGVDEAALDLRPLQTLLVRIDETYHAEQIWLFGSRARGDARPESDWDLFVVVPDETDDRDLDPRIAWRLQRGSGVHADVIPCRATDFRNARDTVNTLSYIVATEGVLIHGRYPAPARRDGGSRARRNPLKAALREIDELAAYATAYRYPTPAGGSRMPLQAASWLCSLRR